MPTELPPILVTARFLSMEFDSGGGSGGSVGGSDPGIFRDYDALEDSPKAADGTPISGPGDIPPLLNDNGLLTESEKQAFRAAVAYLFEKIANTPLTPADQNTATPLGVLEASEVYSRFMNYDMRITTGILMGSIRPVLLWAGRVERELQQSISTATGDISLGREGWDISCCMKSCIQPMQQPIALTEYT